MSCISAFSDDINLISSIDDSEINESTFFYSYILCRMFKKTRKYFVDKMLPDAKNKCSLK